MKTRLMHIRVNVSNIEKAKTWYENVLGFETDGNGGWPPEKPNYYQFQSDGGAAFSIMEEKTGVSGRLNFAVSNVDELWLRLKDKTEIVEALFDTPWGTHKFSIKDLDGNELGFCQE